MSTEGIVKRWDDEGGFGFILATKPPQPPNARQDIFVGRAHLMAGYKLVEGGICHFDMYPSDKRPGTMVAKNISGPGVVLCDESPAGQIKGLQAGTVQKWDDDKSYGFIKPVIGGEDLFVRRDGFGGKGLLIEGLTVWFQAQPDPLSKKGANQLQAKFVSGPGVLLRADQFKPGDLVVYREGTATAHKNDKGEEGSWKLGEGETAVVVKQVGEHLVLDNGEQDSEPLHAAFWWKKAFIMVEIRAGVEHTQKGIEAELKVKIQGNRLESVEKGGIGRQYGLKEGMTVRWVAGEDVVDEKTLTDALGTAPTPLELIFAEVGCDPQLARGGPAGLRARGAWEAMYKQPPGGNAGPGGGRGPPPSAAPPASSSSAPRSRFETPRDKPAAKSRSRDRRASRRDRSRSRDRDRRGRSRRSRSRRRRRSRSDSSQPAMIKDKDDEENGVKDKRKEDKSEHKSDDSESRTAKKRKKSRSKAKKSKKARSPSRSRSRSRRRRRSKKKRSDSSRSRSRSRSERKKKKKKDKKRRRRSTSSSAASAKKARSQSP